MMMDFSRISWPYARSGVVCSSQCRGLAPASNKGPRGCSVTPPPAGVGRRIGRKRQNLWARIRTV